MIDCTPRGIKFPARAHAQTASRVFGNAFGNSQSERLEAQAVEYQRYRELSEISEMAPSRLSDGGNDSTDDRRTAAAHALQSYTVARAVSPWSHRDETMQTVTRIFGKRIATCENADIGHLGRRVGR